jgi:hypothetical protein
LGANVLAAIDHAVFDVNARADFPDYLDAREIDALRGAGLATSIGAAGSTRFAVPQRFSEFRNAVSDVMAKMVNPTSEISDISAALWSIERRIRRSLRGLAIEQHQGSWRKNVLHGDLGAKALERARNDNAPAASSLSDLRDPLEWLSLGELLEVVEKFNHIGSDALFWRRFGSDVVPIRNRLSHMRLTRKGDRENVHAWESRIRKILG